MTNYFVDASGLYLGGFDGAEPPPGAIEVPSAPQDARQTWVDGAWTSAPAVTPTVLKSTVQARIIAAGKMDQAYAALITDKTKFARWFAPDRPVVNCDDPDAVALLTSIGLDPAVILAP